VLAAVDYREANNDPARSALSGETIGTANPDNGAVTTSKLDSLRRAGDHVRTMAASAYGVTLTAASPENDVKAALLAYNRGFIYKNAGAGWEASPYVINRFDAAHMDMAWPTLAGEPLAGLVDTRYGAWTLVARLGGAMTAECAGLALGALTLGDGPDEPTELASVAGITVSARLAPYLAAMLAAAAADGIVLGGSGYRSTEAQVRLRLANGCPDVYTAPASSCGTPTAIPGRSMHEVGEAVDFTHQGHLITSRDDPAYRWLAANAARYGLYNLPSEPWHFSTSGR
jgi:hypothetical protein